MLTHSAYSMHFDRKMISKPIVEDLILKFGIEFLDVQIKYQIS